MVKERSAGFDDLLLQMRITNKLIAAQLRSQLKQSELIALLASTGATAKEIADILGTTAGTVSNAMVRQRKTKQNNE